jgi:hypothetical protein
MLPKSSPYLLFWLWDCYSRRFCGFADRSVIRRIADQCRTLAEVGDVPIAEVGLLDPSILARHNSTCRMTTTSVCRCYGDSHATMASGRVRLATEGGAKMAR